MDTLIEVSVDHHDKPLSIIFEESGGLINFFHTIFGFLYRCTDFYLVNNGKVDVGNPPGTAEAIVLTVLNHWKEVHEENPTLIYTNEDIKPHDSAVCEVEIKFHHQSEDAEQHMPTFESELTNDVDDCDITPVQAEDIVSEVDVPQNGEDDIVIEEVECVIVHRPNLYVQESVHSIAINTDEIETTSIDENPPMTDAYILDRIPQNVITEHVSETIDVEESPVGVFYEQDPHNPSASNAAYLIVHSNAEPRDSDSHEVHVIDNMIAATENQECADYVQPGNKYTIIDLSEYGIHIGEIGAENCSEEEVVKLDESESAVPLKQFMCEICGKGFQKKRILKRHLLLHSSEKPFKCHICVKAFKAKEYLNLHLVKCHHIERVKVEKSEPPKELVCVTCGKYFKTRQALKRHSRIHLKESRFQCSFCDKRFQRKDHLHSHMLVHSEKQFKCTYCEKYCRHKMHLKKHMLTHSEKKFSCEICQKAFYQKLVLTKHMLIHSKHEFACQICGKTFSRKGHLNSHSMVHSNKMFKCEQCGSDLKRSVNWKRHLIIHPQKRFRCDFCDRQFNQKCEFNRHVVNHSEDSKYKCYFCGNILKNENRKFKCKICKMKFHCELSLNVHFKFTQRRDVECKICSKSFHLKQTLKNHLSTHGKKNIVEKLFKCDYCGNNYSSKVNLNLHLLIHSEKKFKCEVCLTSFHLKNILKQHSLIHTNEKEFICGICNKTFIRNDHLKSHVRMHSQVKRFQCNICCKKFKRKENLNQHLFTHSKKNLMCDVCGKLFHLKHLLRKHILRHNISYPCLKCKKTFNCEGHLRLHAKKHLKNEKIKV